MFKRPLRLPYNGFISANQNAALINAFGSVCKMAEDEAIEKALETVMKEFKVNELKEEQREILSMLLAGQDCIAVLPTGYGKSLPYQMFVPVLKSLSNSHPDQFQTPGKVIVCCPLVSLMQDQVKRLATISCVTAAYKGDSSETDDLIREGKIDIIFASPETLVGDRHWRNDLEKLNVCAIVVDEFHTILSWGGLADEEEKSVFRKWFRHIGELRSLFSTVPVLALSATCTKAVKKRVMSVLNFDDKTRFMFISPNKENIKFVVHRTANDAEAAIFWLVEALAKFENAFPKIIVYCNSIKDVSSIYNIIVTELPEAVSYVEMYHSETTDEKKEQILRDIGEGQRLKIVIATSALGMGVDVADCHNIVFYGPPKTIVDLVQQAGRAGRDGEQSTALLLCNPHQLVHIDDDVKEIVRTKTCRRSAIMQCFLSSSEVSKLSNIGRHNCCDLCMTVCACGECNQTAIEQLLTAATLENKEVKEGSCSDSDTISYEYESDLELANMEMPE
ncbi:ATP-dependent DNA helicase RecQ-like [Argopecten irradians]|uniref:ATP-dependent DNA helicase RecQ-like n=1 Tax=Argopecten irradians TaxID=31199 RepID=UPI003715A3CF